MIILTGRSPTKTILGSLVLVTSILSTTVKADKHVHKTMKYEAEQKYKIGPKDNLHCDLNAMPNTSNFSYFCDSGIECGNWNCDNIENGGVCDLTCLNGGEVSGSVQCKCYMEFGPIRMFTGCKWEVLEVATCPEITTTMTTTTATEPTTTSVYNDSCLINNCHDYAHCLPLMGGGYECVCPHGYTGDGWNCAVETTTDTTTTSTTTTSTTTTSTTTTSTTTTSTTTSTTTTSTTTSTTTTVLQCRDIKNEMIDEINGNRRVLMRPEFWKCSPKEFGGNGINDEGTQCKLLCGKHKLKTSFHFHKRSCECDIDGNCDWTGDDVYCYDDVSDVTVTTTDAVTATTVEPTTTEALDPSKTCGDEAHLFDRNGEWHCSENDIGHGTICFLRCNPGFYGNTPLMKRKCKCNDGGENCRWTGDHMKCIDKNIKTTVKPTTQDVDEQCPALEEDHGYWKCSKGHAGGSKCHLLCYTGFSQVKTRKKCKCKKGKGCAWKGKDRACEENSIFTTIQPEYEEQCGALEEKQNGFWSCDGENVGAPVEKGTKCKLNCDQGYVVNSRGITRRCRCSKSRKKCGWTSHTLQCVKEGSDEDLWNNFEVPVDYDKDQCEPLFAFDTGVHDEFPNGQWECRNNGEVLSPENHKSAGAKCELMCDTGYQVLKDGGKRRCRYHMATDSLQWSGRVRYCRTPAENERILAQERYEQREMKKLDRLQQKERNENQMSNDFIEFNYHDELGANEIQELIPKFDRRLQSSARVLPLYRTPPPIEQKTESVDDHARLSKIIQEIEAEVKEASTFERILTQGMQELEALETTSQAPTHSEEVQPTQFDKIKQNGETYINAFDFFQRFQRWMYEHGLFNFNGFGAA